MKNTLGSALSRSLRPAIVVALMLLAAGWWFRSGPEPPAANTDARIAWYKERIGGRGTYPLYARLGLAYLQKARETGKGQWYAEAEGHLRTSQDYQSNYEALLGLGMVHAARHEFTEAQRYAAEASAARPESIEAQGLLFEIALALGDAEKAGAVVANMTARAPATFEAASREAAFHEYRGSLNDALASMAAACGDAHHRHLPAGARAWCEVRHGALLLSARCDAAGAEQAYQNALAILPNYYFAREHLAELHAAQGNAGEAIAIYESLLRDLPSAGYRLELADLYQAAGRTADARRERTTAQEELQRSVESGSREHVRDFILLAAEQKDKATEALRLAEAEASGRRDWYSDDALAWAYYHNGRLREAAEAMDRALASGTKAAGPQLRAAEIFLRAGQPEDARRLLGAVTACPAALTPGDSAHANKLRDSIPR